MKKDEKDYEYLETPPEIEARGLRFITRPKTLDKILETRETKSRITIYLDTNVLMLFKERAKKEHTGYQTLINNALKSIVHDEQSEAEKQSLKKELLEDKKFLRDLKKALA